MILSILYFILFIAKHKKYKSNKAEIIDIENNLEEKKSKKNSCKKTVIIKYKVYLSHLIFLFRFVFFLLQFFL